MDSLIKFCAQYLIFFIGLFFLYVVYRVAKKQRPWILVAVIIATVIAVILSKLAGKLYYDPRPFVSSGVKPLFAHAPDNGFPSDHTIGAMALTTVIYFYRKKFAAIAFVLTLIVGSARVAAHVHSPIDIIGGLIIGAAAGLVGYYLGEIVKARYGRQLKSAK